MTEIYQAWVSEAETSHEISPGCHTVLARVRSGSDDVELRLNNSTDTMLLSPNDACATYIGPSSIPFVRISYKKGSHKEAAKARLDLVFLR